MSRRLAALAAVVVACSVLAPTAFATDASAADHEIEDCTVIDESGEYELVDDIQTTEEESCIEIRAPDVTVHGNGHTVSGPGPVNEDGVRWAGVGINQSEDDTGTVVVRNLQVEAFENGLHGQNGGPLVVEDAVLRGNDRGVEVTEFRDVTFRNTTIADNDGIGYRGELHEDITFTDVTVEDNGGNGWVTFEVFDVEVTSSTVRDNDGTGMEMSETGDVNVTSSTIRDNDGHGAAINMPGSNATLTNVTVTGNDGVGVQTLVGNPINVSGGEVTDNGDTGISLESGGEVSDSLIADNGGHGIELDDASELENVDVRGNAGHGVLSYWPLRLTDVALEDNARNELHSFNAGNGVTTEGNVTAENLAVGPSATTAFEQQAVNLEPVELEALPPRGDGTAVGDGLNVTGNVTGAVDLELDVDTDDGPVDLWRFDGDAWETVEADLPVTDGIVEASVDRDGIYALGTDDVDSEPSDRDGEKETPDAPTDGGC